MKPRLTAHRRYVSQRPLRGASLKQRVAGLRRTPPSDYVWICYSYAIIISNKYCLPLSTKPLSTKPAAAEATPLLLLLLLLVLLLLLLSVPLRLFRRLPFTNTLLTAL